MQAVATSLDYTIENFTTLCSLGLSEEKAGQAIIPIGRQSDGLIAENFASIPSTLIVGTTGSGKSAFVKTLIVEMMQKYTPEQVRFAIYDSRRVDYGFLNSNPFLIAPVYSDPSKATGLIQWSLVEARRRMNNLDQIEKLPHVFILLDDFGEIAPSNDTISSLIQLFQIARRAKIHCWLVTSTPSSNVLPTDLKANINHKIAFRVSSKSISRIVLDDVGAEMLNVPGEIIAKLNNDIVKCESVFLEETDIEALSKEIAARFPSSSVPSASGNQAFTSEADPFIGEDGKDILYAQAVDVVLDTKQASVSMIQRRLKLGYSRAARLIDQMEEDGIVGPFEGSKPRLILISRDQWQRSQLGVSSNDRSRGEEISYAQPQQYKATIQDQTCTLTPQDITLATGFEIKSIGNSVIVRTNSGESAISGKSITELLVKKPGFLRKGILSIHFSVMESEVGNARMTKQKSFDIPFEPKDTISIRAFCKQLALDVSKPVVEL